MREVTIVGNCTTGIVAFGYSCRTIKSSITARETRKTSNSVDSVGQNVVS
jgi:hypothetical protein